MKSECLACGQNFSGVWLFDEHRTGKMTQRGPDYGRRCLSTEEMIGKGWTERAGKWHGKARENQWWNTGESNG